MAEEVETGGAQKQIYISKKRPGRKKFKATDDQRIGVKVLAAIGWRHDLIAQWAGVPERTLELHFKHELQTAFGDLANIAGTKLVEAMKAGAPWALSKFFHQRMWRDQYGAWREPPQQVGLGVAQLGGPDSPSIAAPPLTISVQFEKPDGSKSPVQMPHDRADYVAAEPVRPDPVPPDAALGAKRVDLRRGEDYGPMPLPKRVQESNERAATAKRRQEMKAANPGAFKEDIDLAMGEAVNAGQERRHWMSK
jgi:hypothetical protein